MNSKEEVGRETVEVEKRRKKSWELRIDGRRVIELTRKEQAFLTQLTCLNT